MRINEITEGGWDITATQATVITPQVIKKAIGVADQLIQDFNQWLEQKQPNTPLVQRGALTGSSAYYDVDSDEQTYGDVDMQLIVPQLPEYSNLTLGQIQSKWIKLLNEFLSEKRPGYVHAESRSGHPVLKIDQDQWVQVDIMPHPKPLAHWARWRVTPQRGVKGLLTGNMFSVLGHLLDMSIQHGGVQYKVRDGQQVPFAQRKDTQVVTISTSPETFVLDIFKHLAQAAGQPSARPHPQLVQYSGIQPPTVRISDLVNAVQGLALSFEVNNMFGQGSLSKFANKDDFLAQFKAEYQRKAQAEINSPKRQKAATPEAQARAQTDIKRIQDGLNMVMNLF